MRYLYQGIHDSARKPPVDEGQLQRIQDLLRRTRSRRFWLGTVTKEHRKQYGTSRYPISKRTQKTLTMRTTELPKQAELDRALELFTGDIRDSSSICDVLLSQLVDDCGYVALSICLHSPEFLAFVETGVDVYETKVDHSLGWQSRLHAITEARDSLELFAKVRCLDFLSPIRYYEGNFQLLLANIFRPYNSVTSPDMFGLVGADDMRETHSIASGRATGKNWALALTSGSPAELCKITYTVTEKLQEDFPELTVGQDCTEDQEDIGDSIFLLGYDWPNHQQWPTDDPREDGYEAECVSCGLLRGPVPTERKKPQPHSCNCTLRELHLSSGLPRDDRGDPRSTLFELKAVEVFGKEVRVLQNVRKGDVLGIYHGEMYPKGANEQDVGERYGGDRGGCYVMQQELPKHRHKKPSSPKRTRKRSRQGQNSEASGEYVEWAALGDDEHRSFRVDSAVRGNWIRYINHSCDPSLAFEVLNLGCKRVTVATAIQDITFGDVLTVGYGKSSLTKRSTRNG